jgi:single stranded DNA-binding protein
MDYQRITVSLIGNATNDGEVKQAKESGKQYGDFRLAVRDRQKETHYYPIRCFGKLAESVRKIKKGAKIFVNGELEISSYTDKEGKKQMSFRALADTYRILGNGRRAEDAKEASAT